MRNGSGGRTATLPRSAWRVLMRRRPPGMTPELTLLPELPAFPFELVLVELVLRPRPHQEASCREHPDTGEEHQHRATERTR